MGGNHVLQSMLRRLFDTDSIQYVASSLQHSIAELFAQQRLGVLCCLIDAFGRAQLKPNAIVRTVLDCAGFKEQQQLHCFLFLKMDDAAKRKAATQAKLLPLASRYSVLGCLLLQAMLKVNCQ